MRIICLLQKITLLEIYLLLNHILEVCSDNVKWLEVYSGDIKPGAFTYPPLDKPETCDRSEDQGLHVQAVEIYNAEDNKCQRNLNLSNPSDNHFMQTLRKACSGRDRCYFVSGLRRVLPKFTCGSKSADSFELSYVCKPLEPDNNRVFDIKTGFMKTIAVPGRNKYYLVLGENETIEHSRCEMSGDNGQLNVTLLHADFTSIQKISGKSCLGNQEVNIDWYSQTHSSPEMCLSRGTFELSMVTGLVWIEISVSQSFTVACITSTGSGSGSSTTTATLSSSTTTTILSLTSTTTPLSAASTIAYLGSSTATTTLSSSPTTTTSSSASSPRDTNNSSSTSDSRQFDVVYTIIIPLSVTILILLIAVVSFVFFVCHRRNKRKRINIYDIPAMRQEDIHPYGVPIGPSEVPHYSHITDHLDVIHGDDGYLEPTVVFTRQEQAVAYEEINL